MQFHIPQYIEIEDKLFGPLTLKQAIYIVGGAGGAYLIWRLIPWTFISLPIILGLGVLTWALAFYPKEKLGKPFMGVLEAGFNYLIGSKLYTWKKTTVEPTQGKEEQFISAQIPAPTTAPDITMGKLSSASFGLDVGAQAPTKVGSSLKKNII